MTRMPHLFALLVEQKADHPAASTQRGAFRFSLAAKIHRWINRQRVEQAFHQAWADHQSAKRRGDTRRIHETRRALTLAQCERLRFDL